MSWVETTRPIRITDLVGQTTLTNDMQTWKNNRRWPTALLFVGPSGTGKTSAARISHSLAAPSSFEIGLN